jgi:hypothetical protein
VCVCVCVRERERERRGGDIYLRPTEYVIAFFINDIFFSDISFQYLE